MVILHIDLQHYKLTCTTVINNMATAEFTMGCDVIIDIFAQNIKSLRDKLIVIKVLDSESNWPEA